MLSPILRLILNKSLEKWLRFFVRQGHWKWKKQYAVHCPLVFPFQRFGYNTFKPNLYRKSVDLIRTCERTGERFWCLAQHVWLFLDGSPLIQIKDKIWSKNYAIDWAQKTVTMKWLYLASDSLKQATYAKIENQKKQR